MSRISGPIVRAIKCVSVVSLLLSVSFPSTDGAAAATQGARNAPAPTRKKTNAELAKELGCEATFGAVIELNASLRSSLADARSIAALVREHKDWFRYLPPCPATLSEARRRPEDWVADGNPCFMLFHPGAAASVRSVLPHRSPGWESNPRAAQHCQQCCYDDSGRLITAGPGAGTPDFVHSEVDTTGHLKWDVNPAVWLPPDEYAATWVPNRGITDPMRRLVAGTAEWTDTFVDVRRGDTIRFYDARGRLVWGEKGSACGPEGSEHVAESLLGFALAPPRLPTARTGSIIGAIYTGEPPELVDGAYPVLLDEEYLSIPFAVGKGGTVQVLASGRLYLGVNDGYVGNNEGGFDVAFQITPAIGGR